MSNPSVVGVIANGEYKIAQFCRVAGYPTCEGANILNFLAQADMEVFKSKLVNCRFASRAEIDQCIIAAGIKPENANNVTWEEAERFEEMFPNLSAETGSGILAIVYNSNEEVLLPSAESGLQDEAFCDFSYIINLDDSKLRCYAYGTKHLFGEYDFGNLPTVEDMDGDYVRTMKEIYGDDYFEDEEE